jgi:SH3-like domain-containing protein
MRFRISEVMEVKHLKNLLTEIDSKIEALEASQKEYLLPDTGNPGDIIQEYLGHRQVRRDASQRLDDLKALRKAVQDKLEKIEAARLEEQRRKEAEERARHVAAETTRITGELAKLDPTSPEAAMLLMELSELRR